MLFKHMVLKNRTKNHAMFEHYHAHYLEKLCCRRQSCCLKQSALKVWEKIFERIVTLLLFLAKKIMREQSFENACANGL